jgi:hypothetical protein
MDAFATPFLDSRVSRHGEVPRSRLRRSVGFSPDGQYVAAFVSFQVVAQHSINNPQFCGVSGKVLRPAR